MRKTTYIILGLVVLFTAQTSFAGGDIEAGKSKAVLCASCHGANGIAVMPSYPNLAGQNEPYIVAQLQAFRSKKRSGGMAAIMQMQAASLSDDDINNLAAYFSSLK